MATQIEPAARDWIEVAEEIASAISAEADRHDREESFVEEGFGMLKQAGLFKALVAHRTRPRWQASPSPSSWRT